MKCSYGEITVVNRIAVPDGGEYVGRPSALGNPFTLRQMSRADAIGNYEAWLKDALSDDDYDRHDVRNAYRRLSERYDNGEKITLVCWCAPKPCHADVIKRLIEGGIRA